MKIFTSAAKVPNGYVANTLLIGDKEQIYFYKAFTLETEKEESAHLMAVRRAFMFKQGTKPLYCQEEPLIYMESKKDLRDLILKDEYCSRFVKDETQFRNPQNEQDEYFAMVCHSQAQVEARMEFLRSPQAIPFLNSLVFNNKQK